MASAHTLDFAALMPTVAPMLCGQPNKAMSKGSRLRFGNHGSMEVDTAEGWFDDHEGKARGGVLELIQHKRGCDKHAALTWLEEQGLKERDDRPLRAAPTAPAFYDYFDAEGTLAYRVERRGKGCIPPFLQYGPDGRGGFHAARGCMQGVPRLPYLLPQLVAADAGEIVFVVEGEKDADRLTRAGLVATTNSGGAGKFGDELAPWFEGRRVVVIPDNDEPGRSHAADVAAKLRPVTTALAVLGPMSGKDKGDISDWFAMGGSAFDLKRIAEEALVGTIEAPATLPLIDIAAWDGEPTPAREWALHEWIPARQATYLTGPGSAGKSLMTQQLCTCIALGIPFMGIETKQSVAMYITCEDDADELHRRQKAICASLGVRLRDVVGKLHLVSLMGELGNELITFDDRDHASPSPRFAEVLATAAQLKAGFVALDNVAHLTADEIARNKVAAFVNLLNRMAKDIDGSVLFLGHPNKAGDQFSGSTAWENQVRSRLFLETPKEADGAIIDPDMRELSRGKANYARNGEVLRFRWHQWAFVRDEDLPANVGAEIAANIRASAENDAFLKCLAKAAEEKRATSTSKSASNFAPRVFAKMTIGKGISERGFEAAMERLLHLGTIRNGERVYQRDNRAWVTGLGVPSEVAPTLAPTPAQTLARRCTNQPQNADSDCTDLHALTPLDTTYLSGAPLGVGAPSQEEKSAPFPTIERAPDTDLSRVVFRPPDSTPDPFSDEHWPEDEQ